MIEYRELQIDDIEPLLPIAKKIHAGSEYQVCEFATGKMVNLLSSTISEPNRNRCFLAFEDGEIVGIMISILYSIYCSEDLIANEYILWVDDRHHGCGVATVLINDFTNWADKNNALMKYVYTLLGTHTERAKSFFEKNGFELTGYAFKG
ncbi:MAG: GNAT family N-acetyltransferase [Colwellia sp.]|nr:GNAT family N-acetyltransferase [Colwellia sp.]